jgi:hypothetical protein
VKTILPALAADGWARLSAGDGAKGPRWYDWRWLPLADPLEPTWRRWLLVRRSVSDPIDLAAYVVFAAQDTLLEKVVRVAGARWTIESGFEAAKSEVGLEQYEVRSWTGWYRHITLVVWALALLAVLRAGAIAVELLKKARGAPRSRAVWRPSRLAAASNLPERAGDPPVIVAPGPGPAADCGAHPGLVVLAALVSSCRQVLP